MHRLAQSLKIHLHKVDGSTDSFIESETEPVKRILAEFRPAQIFAREKIIITSGNVLTSVPLRQVVRIDLVSEPPPDLLLPPGIVNAVELAETEYQELLQHPELGERWNQWRGQPTSAVVFLEVEMTGLPRLFLAVEVPLALPADRPEAILHPLYPLATPALCFRTRNSGVAALNPFHVMRFTLFPAPPHPPTVAWAAQPGKPARLERPAPEAHEPAENPPPQSLFPPRDPLPIAASRESPNENVSTMKN